MTEDEGLPPPLIGINLSLPPGFTLDPSGFPACGPETLPQAVPVPIVCPKGSAAGPVGEGLDVAFIRGEGAKEKTTIEAFYGPGGTVELYTFGQSPVSLETKAVSHYVPAGGPNGEELITEFPLVASLPGAPDVSTEAMKFRFGSAERSHGERVFYLRLPEACPHGGFPLRSELVFAGAGSIAERTVTKTFRAPCPRLVLAVEPQSLPPTPLRGAGGAVIAPAEAECARPGETVIHVVQIKGLRYRRVAVTVDGHQSRVLNGSRTHALLDLKGLPRGSFTLRVTLTTTTGHRLSGTRTYRPCLEQAS